MTRRFIKGFALAAAIAAASSAAALAQSYEVTKLVPGSAFHGVHGLGIDKSGRLFAGSVAGAALYEVDRAAGTAKIAISTADGGMADDIAFAPDGTMAWTGFITGDLYARKGDGPIRKLASGLSSSTSSAPSRWCASAASTARTARRSSATSPAPWVWSLPTTPRSI